MHLARNYLGTEGLDQSFQGSFPETVQCKCGGNTRIALVICEEGGLGARTPENRRDNPKLICDLRKAGDDKWVHDCCSIAIYFCTKCLKPTATFDQA